MKYSRRRFTIEAVILAIIGVVFTAASIYALKDGAGWINHGPNLTEGAILLRLSRLAVLMEIVIGAMIVSIIICLIGKLLFGHSAIRNEGAET